MNRFLALALIFVGFSALSYGCTAEDEVKRGEEGEYCSNSDEDCREGYLCDRNRCRAIEIDGTSCESMCERINSCGAEEPDCLGTCLETIDGDCSNDSPCPWSDDAVEVFGSCFVNDLTCDQIINENAPQLCYEAIPLDQQREQICLNFTTATEICNPTQNTDTLRSQCYYLARTSAEASWQRVFECAARINDGFCGEIGDCLNAVFALEPTYELGDDIIDFNNQTGLNNTPVPIPVPL